MTDARKLRRARREIAELHDVLTAFVAITDPEAFPAECERAFLVLTSGDHTICRALDEAERERDQLRTALKAAQKIIAGEDGVRST